MTRKKFFASILGALAAPAVVMNIAPVPRQGTFMNPVDYAALFQIHLSVEEIREMERRDFTGKLQRLGIPTDQIAPTLAAISQAATTLS
jgi:hypothetical protein